LRGLRREERTEIFRRRERISGVESQAGQGQKRDGDGDHKWSRRNAQHHLSPLSDSDTRRSYKRGRTSRRRQGAPLRATAQTPSTRTAPEPALRMISPGRDSKVLPNGFFEPYGFSSMSCSSTGSLMRSSPPPGGVRGSDPYQLFSPWNTGALRLLQSGAGAGPGPEDATRGSRPEDLAHDPRAMNRLNGRKIKYLSVTVDLMSPDLKKVCTCQSSRQSVCLVLQCDQESAGQRLRTRSTDRTDHGASKLQVHAAHRETGWV
jgi:hypothetical protein